jgi:signal transduction histidine kinase
MTEQQPTTGSPLAGRASPSLLTKLLLFTAALVLLPGVLLALIADRSASDSLQQVIGNQLAREAGHTAERLSATLHTERQTLESFARQDLMREIRVADIDKRVSVALMTLRDGSPVRLDYLVVDLTNEVVAASDPGLIGSPPEWAVGVRNPERLAGPLKVEGREATGLVMTTSIRDPDDGRRSIGTLVGLLDWEALTAVTESVRQDLVSRGAAVNVLVSRGDGMVIGGARSPAADGQRANDLAGVVAAMAGGEPDYTVDAAEGFIIGHASLAPDLPNWKLLVVEPRSHALAPARRLSQRIALAVGFVLVAGLAVAAVGARRVVQPLSELSRAIRGFSRGETRTLRVPVRTEDEVGAVAESFNQMASELDQAQRDLVEAEKFAFVGELAAGIAHEIRTALGVLGSSAQMLERSLPEEGGAEAAELAGMIRAEVGRLGGVVNDLLTLDRVRPLELEAVRASELLTRAAEFVAPQASEKGVTLATVEAGGEALLSCDAELMYQVAVNLVVNAIQALQPGGRIELRGLAPVGGLGGFEVADDGPGVPDEIRDRIFQPFVTARARGVGLGLTFVKRVVHDHRGTVELESRPGEGTRVHVKLPAAEPDR